MTYGRRDYEKDVIISAIEGYPDRHGKIIMIDGFEDFWKWDITATNPVHSATATNAAAYNGNFGAELEIGSSWPPVMDYLYISRYVPVTPELRLQLMLLWKATSIATMGNLIFWFVRYTGTHRQLSAIRYDPWNHYWDYYNDTGNFRKISGSDQSIDGNSWNKLTLTFDLSTNKYIAIKSNELTCNLAAYGMQQTVSGMASNSLIRIETSTGTLAPIKVYLDEIVLKSVDT